MKPLIATRSVAFEGSSREVTFDVGPQVFIGIFQAGMRREEPELRHKGCHQGSTSKRKEEGKAGSWFSYCIDMEYLLENHLDYVLEADSWALPQPS